MMNRVMLHSLASRVHVGDEMVAARWAAKVNRHKACSSRGEKSIYIRAEVHG
jgi:hypothetical protein